MMQSSRIIIFYSGDQIYEKMAYHQIQIYDFLFYLSLIEFLNKTQPALHGRQQNLLAAPTNEHLAAIEMSRSVLTIEINVNS